MTVVALVGGFGAPPALLRPLRDHLRSAGHTVNVAPLGLNVDCGEKTVGRLTSWVQELHGGNPVIVVGHSRGGQLGRVLSVRKPELVTQLVTVCTPWSIGPPERPGVGSVTAVLKRVRQAGLPIMGSIECADGPCCSAYRQDVAAKPSVRWSALWSSTDRVAGDDGRPPRLADDIIDIRTSHTGAVTSRVGRETIAATLRP